MNNQNTPLKQIGKILVFSGIAYVTAQSIGNKIKKCHNRQRLNRVVQQHLGNNPKIRQSLKKLPDDKVEVVLEVLDKIHNRKKKISKTAGNFKQQFQQKIRSNK